MIIYKDVDPVKIENTIMTEVIRDGVHMVTRICPIPGFVLHDNAGNWTDPDDTNTEYDAYFRGICSCAANYDFITNPREFYAVPEESVPENQVF